MELTATLLSHLRVLLIAAALLAGAAVATTPAQASSLSAGHSAAHPAHAARLSWVEEAAAFETAAAAVTPAAGVAVATPEPLPAVTIPPPPAPPLLIAAPVALANRLVSADGSLDVPVGVYSDCTGHSGIDSDRPDLDTCVRGRAYFVGHSPGPFAPILAMNVGARITWYDGAGVAHPLVVVSRRDIAWKAGLPHLATDAVVAQFQTCITLDGSLIRILDAVAA